MMRCAAIVVVVVVGRPSADFIWSLLKSGRGTFQLMSVLLVLNFSISIQNFVSVSLRFSRPRPDLLCVFG